VATDQAEQRQEASEGASSKAQEVATQAQEQVQQKAEMVKGKASDRIRGQLDARSTQAGDQAASVARALRKAGEQLESEGSSSGANVVEQAADRVERLAGYLSGSSSDRFLADLESFSRQRPWTAGAIAAALGFVGARFLKASSESRYGATPSRLSADLPISRDSDSALPSSLTPDRPDGSR
jgi:ElaB/YqjD/DUF883 family membrane-anchored ribosome-binding protein